MDNKQDMLEILECLQELLSRNLVLSAKLFVEMEIDNIKGVTPKKCRDTFFEVFCDKCSNTNCPDNKTV